MKVVMLMKVAMTVILMMMVMPRWYIKVKVMKELLIYCYLKNNWKKVTSSAADEVMSSFKKKPSLLCHCLLSKASTHLHLHRKPPQH